MKKVLSTILVATQLILFTKSNCLMGESVGKIITNISTAIGQAVIDVIDYKLLYDLESEFRKCSFKQFNNFITLAKDDSRFSDTPKLYNLQHHIERFMGKHQHLQNVSNWYQKYTSQALDNFSENNNQEINQIFTSCPQQGAKSPLQALLIKSICDDLQFNPDFIIDKEHEPNNYCNSICGFGYALELINIGKRYSKYTTYWINPGYAKARQLVQDIINMGAALQQLVSYITHNQYLYNHSLCDFCDKLIYSLNSYAQKCLPMGDNINNFKANLQSMGNKMPLWLVIASQFDYNSVITFY